MQQQSGLLMCLLTLAVVSNMSSARAAPAPAPAPAAPAAEPATPSPRLDEQGFWKAWLLYEEPQSEEGGRRKGQIQPKSIFIAPVIKDFPDCAPGYQADALGRCNKLVKVNQNAQLGFLLQKLNAMYANSADKLSAPKRPTTTEGPLQFAIPFNVDVPKIGEFTTPTTSTTLAPPTTTTTPLPTTEPAQEEVTEVAEMMVVAAQVELQDETKSTSVPGAIVTLWHLNETNLTTTPPPEEVTETIFPTETTTLPADMEETTPPPLEVDTMPEEVVTELPESTLMTTTMPSEEIEVDTTPKSVTRRPHVQKIISKPSEPEVEVVEAELVYPEEEPEEISAPPREEPTSPVFLDRPYPDAVVFDRPSPDDVVLTDLTGDNSSPPLQWGRPSAKLEAQPVPSTDRIVFPEDVSRTRSGVPAARPTTPWSWGNWDHTTPRPLLLNFYSHLPQVSHNQEAVGSRTHLTHPAVYQAPGRHTPLFFQELSGHDVANVLGRPWRHHRNHY